MWGRLGSHSIHFPHAKTSAADKSGPHANYQPRARTSTIPARWLSGPARSLIGSPRLSSFHWLLGSNRQSFLRRQRGADQQTMIDLHAPSRSLSSQSSWLQPYKPGHLVTFPHPSRAKASHHYSKWRNFRRLKPSNIRFRPSEITLLWMTNHIKWPYFRGYNNYPRKLKF
jgi:hypothetical protein